MNLEKLELVKKYISNHYSKEIKEVKRLNTGLCHFVYNVEFADQSESVIRIARKGTESLIKSGVYWNQYLSNLEIKLPKLLFYNLEEEFPYMIVEKFAGKDLTYVYDELTGSQKEDLAQQIVDIQETISKLQPNLSFGYALCYNDESISDNKSWKDVVYRSIMRSKKRISEKKIFEDKYAEMLLSELSKYDKYFRNIKPKPFLDDITTKNVLIHNGKLNGIVDVDEICFGDKLFHLALIQMALISQKSDLVYVDMISEKYGLSREELRILDFYTSVICLDFMSEIGQKFNKNVEPEVDEERVKFLKQIFVKYHKSDNYLKTDMIRYGESCGDFYDEKIISEVVRVVKQGKEATVVCCKSHESMKSDYMAVKLYKEKKFRNFKRDNIYHQGRVWDKRLQRAIKNKSKAADSFERFNWVNNEFLCLEKLYDAGVKVPEPIACTEDAVVMEFIGIDDNCASLLKDTRFSKEDAEKVYQDILVDLRIMLMYEIVHGDLSAYNILYHEGEHWIIDFPQAVNPSMNIDAFEIFERDVKNVFKFFQKFGVDDNPKETSRKIWEPIYGRV